MLNRLMLARNLLAILLVMLALGLAFGPRPSVVTARVGALLAPSGEVARIVIPDIGVDSKVVEVERVPVDGGKRWEVADYAVGHHAGSGVPGEGTNIVLAGHNNINGEVFRRLDELDRGDVVSLRTREGEWHNYAVSRIEKVLEDGASDAQRRRNARFLHPTGREQVTLISCWPYKPWPPYRIIVIAEPL